MYPRMNVMGRGKSDTNLNDFFVVNVGLSLKGVKT